MRDESDKRKRVRCNENAARRASETAARCTLPRRLAREEKSSSEVICHE